MFDLFVRRSISELETNLLFELFTKENEYARGN
jgi:hypothetical protein